MFSPKVLNCIGTYSAGTGCPTKLFTLCIWQILSFLSSPVLADFQTVLDYIPTCILGRDIDQSV